MCYQQQQYSPGNFGTIVAGFQQQKDYRGSIGFNLMYHPLTSISIGLVLNYEKRDSNYPFRSCETQSAGVYLKASFF
jgi:hypothetical protein